MEKLKWYVVDKKYVNYLKEFDNKVENIDYKENLKPYIGIIIKINDFKYYVPISSAKEKHYSMKDTLDFIRIRKDSKILGVLNLNNMIPIFDKYVQKLEYNNIKRYKKFESESNKKLYIKLLNTELRIINSKKELIRKNAIILYNIKTNKPNHKLSKRCCDFKLLEEKLKLYNN